MMLSSEMLEIILPALAAGLMIALTHAPLGLEVLKRGIIFIDLAIAQIAGLGLVVANIYLHEPSWLIIQLFALGFALLGAAFFRIVEKKIPELQEAIIGSSFVLIASITLLLLADQPHGGEEIQHLLSGQILFVTWADVLSHLPVYALILILWFAKPKLRSGIGFYALFALAITSSVQLVGVYVVFASLIMPAIAAYKYRKKLPIAWACGITSVIAGIVVSTIWDFPAGNIIVVSYFFVGTVSSAISLILDRQKAPLL
jgi:zinc/manganese transport system permease protein